VRATGQLGAVPIADQGLGQAVRVTLDDEIDQAGGHLVRLAADRSQRAQDVGPGAAIHQRLPQQVAEVVDDDAAGAQQVTEPIVLGAGAVQPRDVLEQPLPHGVRRHRDEFGPGSVDQDLTQPAHLGVHARSLRLGSGTGSGTRRSGGKEPGDVTLVPYPRIDTGNRGRGARRSPTRFGTAAAG